MEEKYLKDVPIRIEGALDKIAEALSVFQGKIAAVPKKGRVSIPTKSGRPIEYNYSTLDDIWNVIRKPLSECGLAVVQYPEVINGFEFLTTLLMHRSGQHIKTHIKMRVMGTDFKSLGAAMTYAKRYAIASLLGVCADEDIDATLDFEEPPESAPVAYLSMEQCKDIVIAGNEEYTQEVLSSLNVKSLTDVPAHLYERILAGAKKRNGGKK